ncbi:alpha-amylase, partial [Candidatus Woesearchaeota archaeon]|nr:alpha-amylase [Candidatus Woesearchaeota archaeon]
PTFKIAFSFSGTVLEQMEQFSPAVLESFQKLIKTGRVEVLGETSHHSLAFLFSKEEFTEQVRAHRQQIQRLFNITPTVFRNTELIYNNAIAQYIEHLGYEGILAEGWDHYLQTRSPNQLYKPLGTKNIKVLLKNYKLSDDLAFRFSQKDWKEWPLTAEKFVDWISTTPGEVINLFMDYETFGEHQWEDSGIFSFLRELPKLLLEHYHTFSTPTETVRRFSAREFLDIPHYLSWADVERDISAWTGNQLQQEALKQIYQLEKQIKAATNPELLEIWRKLQTSDHFYYMCTKWFADGDVHKYFNPYDSPYDAFMSYMNVLQDLKLRLNPI